MAGIKIDGLYPAMVTSFDSNGELAVDAVKKTARFLIKAGCAGIVCNGSTGEAANLSRDERITVIRTTREAVGKELAVIAGTGMPTTRGTVELSRDAIEAGADAVLVITPFNIIPNSDGLFRHFATVAELGFPVILYNLPEHTGVEIDFGTIERLLNSYDNIVGIKESSGDLSYFAEIIRRFGDAFVPINGADALIFQCTLMGSPASILALGNIAPKMIIQVMDLVKRGDVAGAKKIYYKLVPIARSISDAVNFPAPIKAALTLLGRPAGDPRLPTVPVDDEEASSIKEALQTAGLL